jgi:hypothetical protein
MNSRKTKNKEEEAQHMHVSKEPAASAFTSTTMARQAFTIGTLRSKCLKGLYLERPSEPRFNQSCLLEEIFTLTRFTTHLYQQVQTAQRRAASGSESSWASSPAPPAQTCITI